MNNALLMIMFCWRPNASRRPRRTRWCTPICNQLVKQSKNWSRRKVCCLLLFYSFQSLVRYFEDVMTL